MCNPRKLTFPFTGNETFDLINELERIGLCKRERNFIIEDIIKIYGRGVKIISIASFEKISECGFNANGSITTNPEAPKRKIEFEEQYRPYLF